jgi:hypothetical protein
LPPERTAEPERFFFCHMQKTGGISLYLRLQRHFGEQGVYPDEGDGDPATVSPQIMLPVLLERWAARRDQIRVVTGHFPLCTTDLLDAEFRTFTILRDPVDRTLSYLRHHRKTTPEDAELTLEEIYEDPSNFKHLIHDHMVKMLSLRADELRPTAMMTVADLDDDRLRTAKSALEGTDAFGLQDDLEGFAQRLEQLFGWRLGPAVHVNVTAPTEVPASFRKRIAEENRLDMELYEHARELLGARR